MWGKGRGLGRAGVKWRGSSRGTGNRQTAGEGCILFWFRRGRGRGPGPALLRGGLPLGGRASCASCAPSGPCGGGAGNGALAGLEQIEMVK